MDHPLLQHKLSILRDENTGVKDFREVVSEIATLMCYEATRDLPLEEVEIKTPITTAKFKTIAGKKLAIVPVLRAGLGMVDGILTLIPSAKVGHIGLYRDPDTLEPVEYYCRCPTTSPSGRSSFWTPCWQPAALPLRPSSLSKIMRSKISSL